MKLTKEIIEVLKYHGYMTSTNGPEIFLQHFETVEDLGNAGFIGDRGAIAFLSSIFDDNGVNRSAEVTETELEKQSEEAPVNEEPVEEAPVNEEPVEEAPVVEEPVVEKTVEEAPVVEEPVVEETVEEAPVVEEPVVEETVEEAPVVEETVEETPKPKKTTTKKTTTKKTTKKES